MQMRVEKRKLMDGTENRVRENLPGIHIHLYTNIYVFDFQLSGVLFF